ncbi:DUF2917 domain-containing protein [Undibacterium oligocarboniphilum]|uniref:DUF2917 domain-containing protein n=1 Tax=Undibacterium oligocarboniphilum TaxID=666702 RepID=A0A850QIM4_9BURK|nr:DUF2917 domain-containing protein [Undibacterium oligocarboniphilum]MBC3871683.1 DUF2917 domain-containing protein [Undibacterium oligocarboniphilum]NVO79128.1 DUF2917 domain-containing protein [Undibacterium oligocarboniphilum]
MTNNFTNQSLSLQAGETVSGISEQARQIRLSRGRVWLTIAGVDADFWLHAGETMTIPAHRLIVLEADQQDSQLEFCSVRNTVNTPASSGVLSYMQKLTQKFTQAWA